jgi:hypothetical protein
LPQPAPEGVESRTPFTFWAGCAIALHGKATLLSGVARDEGDYALGRSLFETNLEAAPRASLSGLGDIALLEGKLDESARRYAEGLEEAQGSPRYAPIAQFLAGLGIRSAVGASV